MAVRGWALFAILALAACDGSPSAKELVAAPARSDKVSPTAASFAKAPARRLIHLDTGGLSVRDPGYHRPHFSFGAPRAEVETALTEALGPPTAQTSNDECGAGPMEFTRYGGLTVDWQDGKLVGWLAERDERLSTTDGIRPGLKRADLALERSVRVIPGSTLEGEFEYQAADGTVMYGFLTGAGKEQRVESLYAGTNCFFR